MRISVIGSCDKRIIMYTLLKTLAATGPVAYFTSDEKMKRLLPEGQDIAIINNIMIYVGDMTPSEVWEEYGDMDEFSPHTYKHAVYDTVSLLPEADVYIHVKGSIKIPEWESELLEDVPNCVKVRLLLTGDAEPKESEYAIVAPAMDWFQFMDVFEAEGTFESIDGRALAPALEYCIGENPSIRLDKRAFAKILKGRW